MNQEVMGKLRAKVAATRYGNPSRAVRVIAVAGSAGKTTTACLIAELLKESKRTVMLLTNRGIDVSGSYSDDSYDHSAAALQRFLARARREHIEFVVLEVTDNLLKLDVLATLEIDTGVVVNASHSAAVLLEQPLKYVVVPSDHDVKNLVTPPHQVITFGAEDEAEAKIETVQLYRKGTEVKLVIDHQTTFELATHLVGQANALNVAAAAATAYVLSINLETLEDGTARLEAVSGNYQTIDGNRPYHIVVDGAHSDRSVELVTTSAKQLARRRLIVVLEPDLISDEAIIELNHRASRLLLIAPDSDVAGAEHYQTPEEAVQLALRAARQGDTVLLVGARLAQRLENGDVMAERLIASA